jgi:hypothetical protein
MPSTGETAKCPSIAQNRSDSTRLVLIHGAGGDSIVTGFAQAFAMLMCKTAHRFRQPAPQGSNPALSASFVFAFRFAYFTTPRASRRPAAHWDEAQRAFTRLLSVRILPYWLTAACTARGEVPAVVR